jgi:hypothetical protein
MWDKRMLFQWGTDAAAVDQTAHGRNNVTLKAILATDSEVK